MVRPVSTYVKDINVSMMISCQERVSCGVKGQVEETHSLGLLDSADHCHHQTDEDKKTNYTLKGETHRNKTLT